MLKWDISESGDKIKSDEISFRSEKNHQNHFQMAEYKALLHPRHHYQLQIYHLGHIHLNATVSPGEHRCENTLHNRKCNSGD
jgi:hypothetical protein